MHFKLDLIINYLSLVISFLLIVGLLLLQIFKKRFPSLKTLSNLIKIFIAFLIIFAFFLSVINYFAWKNIDISKHLLSPYAPITYILHYSWQHYLVEPIVTILFALIIFKTITLLNKKFNNQFFYDEEPYLAALGILTTGWPNCLFYLSLVLFLGVMSHLFVPFINLFRAKREKRFRAKRGFLFARRKVRLERMIQGRDNNVNSLKGEVLEAPPLQMSASRTFRLSLLYFWLPCALLVLLLNGIISKYLIINQLII